MVFGCSTFKLMSNCSQVAEPLRAMVMGAPLEDARHLAQRYDKMRQDAEAQVFHCDVKNFTLHLSFNEKICYLRSCDTILTSFLPSNFGRPLKFLEDKQELEKGREIQK